METHSSIIITVSGKVNAPVELVWECWTNPDHIVQWNHASADWHTPYATNDLRVGGRFTSRMEARDGSMGFDFGGTYQQVLEHKQLSYTIDDGRKVTVNFEADGERTTVTESFEAETIHSTDLQRSGWQAILDNFCKYTEGKNSK
ncbi:MAG: SRPBCC family protein [Bacteroidetes bacterium]|nr:SRPBCC family protein [Bacteroidota bacterium]